jgi:hypothetical protein
MGELEVYLYALNGGEWSALSSSRFTPCIGARMGPTADLDAVEQRKSLPLPGIKPLYLYAIKNHAVKMYGGVYVLILNLGAKWR